MMDRLSQMLGDNPQNGDNDDHTNGNGPDQFDDAPDDV